MRRQAEVGVAKAWPYRGVACEYVRRDDGVAWQEAIAQAGVVYRPGRATRGRRREAEVWSMPAHDTTFLRVLNTFTKVYEEVLNPSLPVP